MRRKRTKVAPDAGARMPDTNLDMSAAHDLGSCVKWLPLSKWAADRIESWSFHIRAQFMHEIHSGTVQTPFNEIQIVMKARLINRHWDVHRLEELHQLFMSKLDLIKAKRICQIET